MAGRETSDAHGNIVRAGDFVQILALDLEPLANLDQDDLADLRSMIGETFEVESVGRSGTVRVTKGWRCVRGWKTHGMDLTPDQFLRTSGPASQPRFDDAQPASDC